MNTVSRVVVGCVVTALIFLVPLRGNAEEPEPTPKPAATKAPAKRVKTLSDLAGGIKLQQPPEEKAGGVVIDNSNLKAMGEGAVISEGKAMSSSVSRVPSSQPPDPDEPPTESREVTRFRDKVKGLEQQKKALDKAATDRNKTNMYTGAGPQYRPPGVEDPLDMQRQKVDRELDIAKKNLKGAERKARRNRSQSSPSGGSGD